MGPSRRLVIPSHTNSMSNPRAIWVSDFWPDSTSAYSCHSSLVIHTCSCFHLSRVLLLVVTVTALLRRLSLFGGIVMIVDKGILASFLVPLPMIAFQLRVAFIVIHHAENAHHQCQRHCEP